VGEYAELALDYENFPKVSSRRGSSRSIWLSLRESSTHWHCKDGTVLLIAEMEESHINNCMRMMERAGQTWTNAYKAMYAKVSSPHPTVPSPTNESP
jgi:hypothetical protein